MATQRDRHTWLNVPAMALVGWISPFFVLCWAGLRHLVRPGKWREKILGLSICGNLLFVAVLVLGYYASTEPSDATEGPRIVDNLFRRSQGPLYFCVPPPQSELARIVPNAIYVADDAIVRARFEFADEAMTILKEVTICDAYGRPWIDANLQDTSTIYTRYAYEGTEEASVSLMDADGDGIPDTMIDWESGVSFKREEDLKWRRTSKASAPDPAQLSE